QTRRCITRPAPRPRRPCPDPPGTAPGRPGRPSGVTDENPQSERAEEDRDESAEERLDRNTIELRNELRVANTGIQVMFAFLLVVPFQQGWKHVDGFERTVYFVTLLLVALAAFLLMAPSIHHRILFR